MAWATTDIAANDIIQQDGVFAYNFTASGAIKKGQFVWLSADNKVTPCGSPAGDADSIGVACYDAATTKQVAIAGPGNIALCCADASITPGTAVYGDTDGTCDSTMNNATKVAGYVVDDSPDNVSGTVAATYHVITVLLV